MKDEYRPNSTGSSANLAYPIPWGTTTAPIVIPNSCQVFAIAGWECPALTSNKIPGKPYEVVSPDPVEERKQAVYVVEHALAGRSQPLEDITDVDRLFDERVRRIPRPRRVGRLSSRHLVHVRVIGLKPDVEKFGQPMANFGACSPHGDGRHAERISCR